MGESNIRRWLKVNEDNKNAYEGLELYFFEENTAPDDEILKWLNDAILHSRFPEGLIDDLKKFYDTEKVNERFIEPGLPTYDFLRKGFFGETLIGETLIHFFDYIIPVKKNQYAILANQTLPRTDIIVVKTNEETISEVCYVEVKYRTSKDTLAGVEGYNQLKKDYTKAIPELFSWILARLYQQNDPLFPLFRDYIFDKRDTRDIEKNLVGLVYDSDNWSTKVFTNLSEEVSRNEDKEVIVTFVRVAELEKLTKDIFDNIGVVEVIDDE